MIKYIIFDFDGVIADSYAKTGEIFDRLKAQHSEMKDFDYSTIREFGTAEAIKKSTMNTLKMLMIYKKAQKKYSDELSDLDCIEGMPEVIDILSKKFSLGILSSNIKKTINNFLDKNELTPYFDFISLEKSMFGKDKVMKKLLKKLGVKPSEVLYIGDEDRDIVAMKKVGVTIISVPWGFNSYALLKKNDPNHIAKDPKDILKIIENYKAI